jgi:hypothetical protein
MSVGETALEHEPRRRAAAAAECAPVVAGFLAVAPPPAAPAPDPMEADGPPCGAEAAPAYDGEADAEVVAPGVVDGAEEVRPPPAAARRPCAAEQSRAPGCCRCIPVKVYGGSAAPQCPSAPVPRALAPLARRPGAGRAVTAADVGLDGPRPPASLSRAPLLGFHRAPGGIGSQDF